MAATAATAALTATPTGLASSSLSGRRLGLRPAKASSATRYTSRRGLLTIAKYDTSKGVYFDLEDMENTTGAWDRYGQDGPSPYNGLQSKFFETFASPFTKRGLMLKFLLVVWSVGVSAWPIFLPEEYFPLKKNKVKLSWRSGLTEEDIAKLPVDRPAKPGTNTNSLELMKTM